MAISGVSPQCDTNKFKLTSRQARMGYRGRFSRAKYAVGVNTSQPCTPADYPSNCLGVGVPGFIPPYEI